MGVFSWRRRSHLGRGIFCGGLACRKSAQVFSQEPRDTLLPLPFLPSRISLGLSVFSCIMGPKLIGESPGLEGAKQGIRRCHYSYGPPSVSPGQEPSGHVTGASELPGEM